MNDDDTADRYSENRPRPKLMRPKFVKVRNLCPASVGFSMNVKVGKIKKCVNRLNLDGTRLRISEAEIGDSTGFILLSLKNEQIEMVNEGDVLILRNAKIDMVYNVFMRCVVDQWGLIDHAESDSFDEEVDFEAMRGDKEMDKSSIEYQLVSRDQFE